MSNAVKTQEDAKYAEVGKLLSARLHEARAKKGTLRCPSCLLVFDATHLIKCPNCRTLIGATFQEWRSEATKTSQPPEPPRPATQRSESAPLLFPKEYAPVNTTRLRKHRALRPRKILEAVQLELDFFTQGYRQYPG